MIGARQTWQETPRCHVLLVDDDEDDRALNAKTLSSADEVSEITCFSSATALMEYIKTQGLRDRCAPDLKSFVVLVDLNMPKIDGYHVLQGLKSEPSFKGMPVLVMSGLLDYPGMRRALDLGADAVLRKPIDLQKIRSFIGGAHGSHRRPPA